VRDDEIDALAERFNRTFADLERLVDGVRQVSNHIAHDLRRPLQHARQHLEILAHTPALDGDARIAIESSLAEVDNLLGTFAALLRLARLQAGGFERGDEALDLAVIVHDAVELFEPVVAAGGRHLRPVIEPCELRGDRHLLFQAVQNLIENALTHGDGDIDVHLSGNGILDVRDYGSGVPEEALSRLSERFYRVDHARTSPGIGIGLALVRAIAELHGGEVRFANAHPGLQVRVRFAAK
jgi:signal transduction histidine kinase